MSFRAILSVLFIVSAWPVLASSPPHAITQFVPAPSTPEHEAIGKRYMIASQGYYTTLAAKEMFDSGGNAVDAAVAASFAISVERPQSTGIGGGGFMLIRLAKAKKILAVDFRETAPAKSSEKMFQDAQGKIVPDLSTSGILSSATPGLVAGVIEIHQRYGKLSRAKVMAPAIRLAQKGFKVYPHLADAIAESKETLELYPASKALFLKKDGQPLEVGDLLVQKDLAKTLSTIAKEGKKGFYSGWVAKAMLGEHRRLRGNMDEKDLAGYQVKWREPVSGEFKGYRVYSMPPPSSGGTHVVEILNILSGFQLKALGQYAPQVMHLTASAMQLAYADRAKYLGDSDFVSVPVKQLTSTAYADQRRAEIDPRVAKRLADVQAGKVRKPESTETTHFSIADREGNMIASTQTVNGWLGSGVVVPGAGFILNNQMDDFSAKPGVPNQFGLVGGFENSIQPGKRPLSSMSPTIVEKNGAPILALGSPSGSQIITCVTLTILNYVEFGLPLYDAVASMRYHHQWTPDEIKVEAPGVLPETADRLKSMGHALKVGEIGCKIEAVAMESGKLHGVSDPRGEGLSLGDTSPPPPPEYQKIEKKSAKD